MSGVVLRKPEEMASSQTGGDSVEFEQERPFESMERHDHDAAEAGIRPLVSQTERPQPLSRLQKRAPAKLQLKRLSPESMGLSCRSPIPFAEEGKMAEGNVFACYSAEAWRSKLQEAVDTKRLVVVDFTATWCGPCRVISPVFVELSKRFPAIFFLKVDVDQLRYVAQEWGVEAMPTFIFIKDGKAVDKVVGAKKDELQRKVAALATETSLVAEA